MEERSSLPETAVELSNGGNLAIPAETELKDTEIDSALLVHMQGVCTSCPLALLATVSLEGEITAGNGQVVDLPAPSPWVSARSTQL